MEKPVEVNLDDVVPMQQKLITTDRLSGILHVYHQRSKAQPVGANIRFTRKLDHLAQPLRRDIMVNMPWQRPELFWLNPAMVGNVLVENHGTDENQCIWISHNGKDTHEIVLPGMPYFGCPIDIEKFWLCAPAGPFEATITIFPR